MITSIDLLLIPQILSQCLQGSWLAAAGRLQRGSAGIHSPPDSLFSHQVSVKYLTRISGSAISAYFTWLSVVYVGQISKQTQKSFKGISKSDPLILKPDAPAQMSH